MIRFLLDNYSDQQIFTLFFTIVIFILVYVGYSLFLNKLNKMINGKGTILAWIPYCNTYLLGKLAFNKIVGWILVIWSLYTTRKDGITIYDWVFFIVFLCANAKYNKLRKAEKEKSK